MNEKPTNLLDAIRRLERLAGLMKDLHSDADPAGRRARAGAVKDVALFLRRLCAQIHGEGEKVEGDSQRRKARLLRWIEGGR